MVLNIYPNFPLQRGSSCSYVFAYRSAFSLETVRSKIPRKGSLYSIYLLGLRISVLSPSRSASSTCKKLVQRHAEQLFKACGNSLFFIVSARIFCRIPKGGQVAPDGAFRTVVFPRSQKRFLHAVFAAGLQGRFGRFDAEAVVGDKTAPGPRPACKNDFSAQLFVRFQHGVVVLGLQAVIIQ